MVEWSKVDTVLLDMDRTLITERAPPSVHLNE